MYRFIAHFALFQTLLLGLGPLDALAESPPGATVLDLSGPLTTQEQPLHAYSVRSSSINDWEARYRSGLKVAQKGKTLGFIGLATTAVGFAVVGTTLSGHGELDYGGIMAGGAMVIGGSGAMWVGGAVTQSGTSTAHRALADKRLVPRGCASCTISWMMLAPPIVIIGLPISYIISATERASLRKAYSNYRYGSGRYQPSLRLTPIATRTGTGLGIAGTF